ncbi:DUF397 domain-containing protein [Actinokineospora sp.]|uniref:DUF397 domain-containing protein n=1 Tax=Actinokineospora sp. TaxID=1872133 RepID=UPI0040376727
MAAVTFSEAVWRKSSRSGIGANDNCVEVAFAEWRKSSGSGMGGNDNCVEVAVEAEVVGVRDSKNGTGPHLTFPGPAWHRFLADS